MGRGVSFDKDPSTVTLEEAKVWLRGQVGTGNNCPCCNQFVKIYKRKLNSGMARTLIWIVSATQPDQWIAVAQTAPKEILRSNEHGKLVHWGLLEQQPLKKDSNAKCSGIWRATPAGRAFAQDLSSVPSHVYLYDNEVLRFSDAHTNIVKSLGKQFNYKELMSAVA